MKKILYTFLLVSLTLASCQKEQIKAEAVTASDYLTFKVTAVSPSVETPIKWQAESDRIGVFASSATSGEVLIDNAYYSAFSSTATSLFAPLRDDSKLNWEKAGAWMFKSTIPTENPTHLLPHFRFLSLQIRQLRLKVQGSL